MKENENGKKFCFICDTPYQLFCILNLVHGMKKNKSSESTYDLFLGFNFKNVERIYKNLCESSIFNNVYKFDITKGRVGALNLFLYFLNAIFVEQNELKMLNCIAREYNNYYITKIFVIKRYISLKQMSFGYKYNLSKQYDFIFASYFNPFVKNMSLLSPKSHISYFEDGNGSYIMDIFDYVLKHEPDKGLSFTGIDVNRFRPKDLYVVRPELCKRIDKIVKVKLPIFFDKDNIFSKDVKDIYDYIKPDIYSNTKCIFLMTCEDEITISAGKEKGHVCLDRYRNMIEVLNHEEFDIVFRAHPRQKGINESYLKLDDKGVQWELLVQDIISEDSILISLNSTAALTPKLLYNKEPYNLLIGEYVFADSDNIELTKKQENIVKELYMNKEKVIIINSIEELLSIVRKTKRMN